MTMRNLPNGSRLIAVTLSLMLAALAATLSVTPASAQTLTGRASVIDGDTIEIQGNRIRLHGIDAPESDQICLDAHSRQYRCGAIASWALDDWLAQSRPTTCREVNRDVYGRIVARCFRADGASVEQWLVRQGHALDWPRYSKRQYRSDQRDAAHHKRGMFSGRFIQPWDWRAGQRKWP